MFFTSFPLCQVKNVNDHTIENRMESFFLAETTKYLYLIFDPDNWMHNTGGSGHTLTANGRQCVVEAGGYVFNSGKVSWLITCIVLTKAAKLWGLSIE